MLVHGDGRKYATALISLDPEALAQWGRAQGLPDQDYQQLATAPRARVRPGLRRRGQRPAQPLGDDQDFRILDHDLSVEAGELTPSMKVKRKVVEAAYRPLLDEMYAA